MSNSLAHWDPFDGEIEVATPSIGDIKKGVKLPIWLKRAPLPLAFVAMIWTFVAVFFGDGFPFIPVAVTTLAFAAVFVVDAVENVDGLRRFRRVKLAQDKGWSYTDSFLEWQVERTHAIESDGSFDRRYRRVKPARLKKIEARIPELTKVQIGSFVGVQLDGEFWGQSEQDGLPLWIAVGAMQMEAALGTREMRRDAHDGHGGFGQFFSLLGAYKIDRKTGIRAVVSPENIANKGPLDRDIKTESVEFNDSFHISGRLASRQRDGDELEQNVLQILTPATQTTMLDLKARFHNVGFVVDDDNLFFMAQDKLVGQNASEGGIDRLLPVLLAEFEAAKFSIKRYVE